MSIYVEIRIRGSIDELWHRTQHPSLHQRWDLQFSAIDYLPREAPAPQRFRYATPLGLGLRVCGEGESEGTLPDYPVGHQRFFMEKVLS